MKILIAGGGTGGHVFPAVAVAEELKLQNEAYDVLFVGTGEGLEAKLIPALGFPIRYISKAPFVGKSYFQKLKTLLKLPGLIKEAKGIIEEYKPDAVLGVGGYASAPLVYAAYRMKVPTFLLEQNATPGLTNKVLSYFANHVFVSFESTLSYFQKSVCEVTGNPVRKNILEAVKKKKKGQGETFHIFVMGGSQGAHMINISMCEALEFLKDTPKKVSIVHQTGQEDFDLVQGEYKEKKVEADIFPFIDDMAPYYENADLVIGRAGAGTVSELIVTKTPSVLIPYPYAKSHQVFNAEELEKKGAARVVLQQDLSGEKIAGIIKQLMNYEHVYEKMLDALDEYDWGNPAEKIVNFIKTSLD